MRVGVVFIAVVLAAAGMATAEPGNLIATTAAYQAAAVRGYTCASWQLLSPEGRVSYLLGVIALADVVQATGRLDAWTQEAVRLPQSAVSYQSYVDTGCVYAGGTAPVLAVLYTLK